MTVSRRNLIGAAAVLAALPHSLRAQSYPSRTIRLVVPYPPGGVYDGTGRPWAEKARQHFGTIVIENIGGAGSSIGCATVARAQPDGYTILLGGSSGLVVYPAASSKPPYDPEKDFEPIASIGLNAILIVVHPEQPPKTLAELVAYAKSHPDKLSYGSSGVGTGNHLAGEQLNVHAGLHIPHVPYRGAGPAMSDLISGHIPLLFQSVTGQAIEMHRTGKLRILAVTSEQRLPAMPDIPTVVEAGMPEMVALNFMGLFAPKGTPKDVIDVIVENNRKTMQDPQLQQQFVKAGFEPDATSTPESTRALLKAEIAKWTPLIKRIGLRVD